MYRWYRQIVDEFFLFTKYVYMLQVSSLTTNASSLFVDFQF